MANIERTRWTNERIHQIAISGACRSAVVGSSVQMSFSTDPRDDDGSGPATFTVELEAIDARDARVRARDLLAVAQESVGLVAEAGPVVWVAPAAQSAESSHRFLAVATDLIEAENYDAAVVLAQIHLEVQARVILERLLTDDESVLAKAVLRRDTSWSLSNAWHRDVLGSLLETEVVTFPRWNDYVAHVKRRNAVVHRGLEVDSEEAHASVDVVSAFWIWLNAAFERTSISRRYPYG